MSRSGDPSLSMDSSGSEDQPTTLPGRDYRQGVRSSSAIGCTRRVDGPEERSNRSLRRCAAQRSGAGCSGWGNARYAGDSDPRMRIEDPNKWSTTIHPHPRRTRLLCAAQSGPSGRRSSHQGGADRLPLATDRDAASVERPSRDRRAVAEGVRRRSVISATERKRSSGVFGFMLNADAPRRLVPRSR